MLENTHFVIDHKTGDTIKLMTPEGVLLDSCDANIGQLKGEQRQLKAILCDGALPSDQWQVMNVVSDSGMFLDHVAVKGAVSAEQAERLCTKYLLSHGTTAKLQQPVSLSDSGLKIFLDSATTPTGTAYLLKTDAAIYDSMSTSTKVQWSEDNHVLSHDGQLSNVMFDMARYDVNKELLTKVTPQDIAGLLIDDQCTMFMYDAMVLKYRQLDTAMQKIAEALKAAGHEEFFVKNVTPIEPFKRQGVVNVGAIFEMSDTQTVTVLFNNPDTTPAKLTDSDVITSWKWILNKRDVTAVLQPRAVDAKKYPMIAGRIFQLLAKNHSRFKRAQAIRAKDEALLSELMTQLDATQVESLTLDEQLKKLNQEIDQIGIDKQKNTEVLKSDNPGTSKGDPESNPDETTYILKSSNPRARKPAGSIKLKNKNGIYDVMLQDGTVGGEFIGNITAVKNWLISRLASLGDAIDESASWEKVVARLELKTGNDVLDIAEQAPELTGDEFGEFDIDLPEDKKALREIVKTALKEMVGQSFPCPALNANVEIRTNGVKKLISMSGDARKLQAVAALKELLAIAYKVDERKSYAELTERNIVAYHIMSAPLKLDQESLNVLFVIREDDKGHYHYDHKIEKSVVQNVKSPLLDGLLTVAFPTAGVSQDDLAGLTHLASYRRNDSIESDHNIVNTMFDDANADDAEVLNMFIIAEGQVAEPEDVPEPAQVPEGFNLVNPSDGYWQLRREGVNRFVVIMGDKNGYQAQSQSASSTIVKSLDSAIAWGVTLLNDLHQDLMAKNEQEQDLINNWRDQIPTNLDKELFLKAFDLVKDHTVKHEWNWNDATIFNFLVKSFERFEQAHASVGFFFQLSNEILNNGVNELSRKLYALYTNGDVVLAGQSQKAGKERMQEYAKTVFTQDQLDQYEADKIQAEKDEIEAKKAALEQELRESVKVIWMSIPAGDRGMMQGWLNSGYDMVRVKKGATYRYQFTNPDGSAYRVQNHPSYKKAEQAAKAADATYGSLRKALTELGIIELPKATEPVKDPIEKETNANTETSNPENESLAFLNSVIAGEVDLSADSIGERLESMAENLDPSLEQLFEQAADAYAQFAIKNAQSV